LIISRLGIVPPLRVPLTDSAGFAVLTLLLLKVTAHAPLLSRVPLTDSILPHKQVP
jgi:hypothetical protein